MACSLASLKRWYINMKLTCKGGNNSIILGILEGSFSAVSRTSPPKTCRNFLMLYLAADAPARCASGRSGHWTCGTASRNRAEPERYVLARSAHEGRGWVKFGHTYLHFSDKIDKKNSGIIFVNLLNLANNFANLRNVFHFLKNLAWGSETLRKLKIHRNWAKTWQKRLTNMNQKKWKPSAEILRSERRRNI